MAALEGRCQKYLLSFPQLLRELEETLVSRVYTNAETVIKICGSQRSEKLLYLSQRRPRQTKQTTSEPTWGCWLDPKAVPGHIAKSIFGKGRGFKEATRMPILLSGLGS